MIIHSLRSFLQRPHFTALWKQAQRHIGRAFANRRRRSRSHWPITECLESRILPSTVMPLHGGPYSISSGYDLMLDGSTSMGEGTIYYDWTVNGIVAGTDSTRAISWNDLVFGYGVSKGMTANTYPISLRVTDDNGDATVNTTLTVAANIGPFASLSSNPVAGADGKVHINPVGGFLYLDGSTSMDGDMGDTVTYSWDVLNDGIVDWTSTTTPWITLTWDELVNTYGFSTLGSYPVKLTVSDGFVSASTIVDVVVDNIAPNASASTNSEGQYIIFNGEDLQLNASNSSDVDAGPNPLTYSWDLNNDGTFGDATGSNPTILSSALAGWGLTAGCVDKPISVKVSDGDLSSTAGATVSIWLPYVSISFFDSDISETKATNPPNGGIIRITRDGPNSLTLSGTFTVAPSTPTNGRATVGVDFTLSTTSWTISGSDHVDIPLTVQNDLEIEGNEIIVVTVDDSPGNYIRMTETAEATLADNDHWQWKTYTGTQLAASTTNATSAFDWPFDLGPAHLTMTASGTATSNSVSALMDAEFYNPDTFSYDTYYAHDDLNISFDFDPISGEIFVSGGQSNANVEGSGPLKATLGLSHVITNTATTHSVAVTIEAIAQVTGSLTATPGVDYIVNLSSSAATNIEEKIRAWKIYTLELEQVED